MHLARPDLRRLALLAAAGAVLLLALGTRMLAVGELNPDFDEDDYLRAGQLYATGLQAGDPGVFLRENYRPEHPPLSKIVTGLAIAPLAPAPEIPDVPITAGPNNDLPEPHLTVARTAGAVFGALTAFLLALVSPLGGLWLALHTWSIKYSSQVMLEAVPAFFALLAVLLSTRAWRPGVVGRRRAAWLAAAAIAFGLACAGKYLYGVAGLAIAVDWALRVRSTEEGAGPRLRGLVPILAFLALGAVAFLAANPYLWPDPVGRLISSITYHGGYVGTDAVQETGWPIWQPLVWLMGSVPAGWQDGVHVRRRGRPPDHRARRDGPAAPLGRAAGVRAVAAPGVRVPARLAVQVAAVHPGAVRPALPRRGPRDGEPAAARLGSASCRDAP